MNNSTMPPGNENVALLIIDVQRGLFNRPTPIYRADRLLKNIQTLVDHSHEKCIPVFYIQHENKSMLAKGTEAWELHPQMHPESGDGLIHKRHGSAFQETDLEKELIAREVGKIIVTGLVTQGCVRATCLNALELGYKVLLVEDAHSNYSKDAERIIEEWHNKLSEKGVELIATEEIQFG
jgi:nicotinamidase-related amidase